MAEMESKFRIRASATGFTNLEKSADRLAAAFRRVGQAGLEMGAKTQQGMRQVAKTLRDSGGVGSQSVAESSRTVRAAPSRSTTISTGSAAAMRAGHGRSADGGGGGQGGGGSGAAGSGGGGGRRSSFAPTTDRASGSFTQGLLQGALPESFIERGPGAYRQAAGVLAGRTARQTVGAAADFVMSAGRGPEAVAGAVGQIPFVGGLLAHGLGAGIQAARGEAAAQGSFASMMPYVSQTSGDFVPRLNAERERLGRLGMQYGGLSQNQSLAAFASASAQAGGVTRNISDQRLSSALQAQQGYGVDLGTSLRLLRGEDLGQASGGRSANSLAQGLGNAASLGLEGGEVGQYLRRMASDLEEVNRTGIKFSAAGQGSLERAIGRSFADAAGTRTTELSRGINSGLDQIAQNGPQNSAQAMILQKAGFDPDRPETYAQALVNIEDPEKRAKYVSDALADFKKTIGRHSLGRQQLEIKDFMTRINGQISNTEALKAAKEGTLGGVMTGMVQTPAALGDASLSSRAASNTAVSQQREAIMANMDTRTGSMQLDAVQTADMNAKGFTTAVQGVGNTFLNAANSIADVGKQLANFVMPGASAQGANTSFR